MNKYDTQCLDIFGVHTEVTPWPAPDPRLKRVLLGSTAEEFAHKQTRIPIPGFRWLTTSYLVFVEATTLGRVGEILEESHAEGTAERDTRTMARQFNIRTRNLFDVVRIWKYLRKQ